MQAAAPPLSLPQQHQRVDAPQSLPSTRGGDGGASTSNGGGGSKTQNHQQHQSHAARISEAVAKDLAALANPDVSTPFASVDDAVDRLLPYHLLAQEGPEAADADEVDEAAATAAAAASTSGRNGGSASESYKKRKKFLLLSRRQAWLEVSSRRASAACDAAERTGKLAEEAITRVERACADRKEEALLVARWESEEARARLRRAKKEAAAAAAEAAGEAAAAAVANAAYAAPAANAPSNAPPAPLPPPAGYY